MLKYFKQYYPIRNLLFIAGEGMPYSLFPFMIIGRKVYAASIAFTMMLIVIWRFMYMFILDRKNFDEKITLLVSGRLAKDILDEVKNKKDADYTIFMRFIETVKMVLFGKGVR